MPKSTKIERSTIGLNGEWKGIYWTGRFSFAVCLRQSAPMLDIAPHNAAIPSQSCVNGAICLFDRLLEGLIQLVH